jgi:hypothetical protein
VTRQHVPPNRGMANGGLACSWFCNGIDRVADESSGFRRHGFIESLDDAARVVTHIRKRTATPRRVCGCPAPRQVRRPAVDHRTEGGGGRTPGRARRAREKHGRELTERPIMGQTGACSAYPLKQ